MTTANLKSKLEKMNIDYSIVNINDYNYDINFSINNYSFSAGYFKGSDIIDDFCRNICYDNVDQEMQRRFFKSFNELLKYSR